MRIVRLVVFWTTLTSAATSAFAQGAALNLEREYDRAVHAGIEEVMVAVASRAAPPKIDLYAGAFNPDRRFRGKSLMEWLRQLHDADVGGTAAPAQQAFLDMGAKCVPFLVRAAAAPVDWDQADASSHPLLLCRRMGLAAVDPLVRLLESEHTTLSWVVLSGIVRDAASFPGKDLAKEKRAVLNEALTRISGAAAKALDSRDSAARFASLSLLKLIALTGADNKAFIGIPPELHWLMRNDPNVMVREQACDLLVGLGTRGVEGGMRKVDIVLLLKDDSLPESVRHSLTAGLLWHVENEQSRPPKPKLPSNAVR